MIVEDFRRRAAPCASVVTSSIVDIVCPPRAATGRRHYMPLAPTFPKIVHSMMAPGPAPTSWGKIARTLVPEWRTITPAAPPTLSSPLLSCRVPNWLTRSHPQQAARPPARGFDHRVRARNGDLVHRHSDAVAPSSALLAGATQASTPGRVPARGLCRPSRRHRRAGVADRNRARVRSATPVEIIRYDDACGRRWRCDRAGRNRQTPSWRTWWAATLGHFCECGVCHPDDVGPRRSNRQRWRGGVRQPSGNAPSLVNLASAACAPSPTRRLASATAASSAALDRPDASPIVRERSCRAPWVEFRRCQRTRPGDRASRSALLDRSSS